MLRVLLVLVLASGCIEDRLVVCADGVTTCPVGYVCVGDGRCTTSDLRCGDGFLANGETCDGTALGEATCQSEGFYSGSLACDEGCELDTSACSGRCGDGVLDPVEQCDGSTATSCFELGSSFGRASCGSDCQPSTAPCLDLGWQVTHATDAPIQAAVWLGDGYFLRLANGDVLEVDATGELNRWPQLHGVAPGTLAGTSRSDVWLVANGELSHFDGTAWMPITTGLDSHSLIAVASPTRVIVLGMALGLRKLATYDGTSWTLAICDYAASRMAASATELFITDHNGLVIHNGTTWTRPLGGRQITDIASDGTATYAVGERIYQITNDELVPAGPMLTAARILTLGPQRFLAFTNLAEAYEYDGLTWTKLRTPSVVSTTEIAGAGLTGDGRLTLTSGQKVQTASLRLGDQSATLLWAFDDAVWIQHDGLLFRNDHVLDGSTAERSLAWGTRDAANNDVVFITRNNHQGAPVIDRCTRLGCTGYEIEAFRLVALQGSAPTDVWALTDRPTQLLHFDGTAWSPVMASIPTLTDLAVVAPDDVYFVGPSGSIAHFNGQTFIFSDLGLPAGAYFSSVRAFASNRAFAVGSAGVFELVDGTWTQVLDPVSDLLTVGGTGPDDLYAIGPLAMYHRDAAGWIPVALPDLANVTQHLHATDDALWFDTLTSFSRLAPRPR